MYLFSSVGKVHSKGVTVNPEFDSIHSCSVTFPYNIVIPCKLRLLGYVHVQIRATCSMLVSSWIWNFQTLKALLALCFRNTRNNIQTDSTVLTVPWIRVYYTLTVWRFGSLSLFWVPVCRYWYSLLFTNGLLFTVSRAVGTRKHINFGLRFSVFCVFCGGLVKITSILQACFVRKSRSQKHR